MYLETDTSGSLGAGLLQVRKEINCGYDEVPDNVTLHSTVLASKHLMSANWWYSKIAWEALDILHGLEKSHHYYFGREVYVIMDQNYLVVMINKDVATLSQWLQYILLCIYNYSMCILYKSDPVLYIVDCLSWNKHAERGTR